MSARSNAISTPWPKCTLPCLASATSGIHVGRNAKPTIWPCAKRIPANFFGCVCVHLCLAAATRRIPGHFFPTHLHTPMFGGGWRIPPCRQDLTRNPQFGHAPGGSLAIFSRSICIHPCLRAATNVILTFSPNLYLTLLVSSFPPLPLTSLTCHLTLSFHTQCLIWIFPASLLGFSTAPSLFRLGEKSRTPARVLACLSVVPTHLQRALLKPTTTAYFLESMPVKLTPEITPLAVTQVSRYDDLSVYFSVCPLPLSRLCICPPDKMCTHLHPPCFAPCFSIFPSVYPCFSVITSVCFTPR